MRVVGVVYHLGGGREGEREREREGEGGRGRGRGRGKGRGRGNVEEGLRRKWRGKRKEKGKGIPRRNENDMQQYRIRKVTCKTACFMGILQIITR